MTKDERTKASKELKRRLRAGYRPQIVGKFATTIEEHIYEITERGWVRRKDLEDKYDKIYSNKRS